MSNLIVWKMLLLLVLFQLKHFLADFPLQTQYMLGKFKGGKAWILPLLAHGLVHAAFTFLIAYAFTRSPIFSAFLAYTDLKIHTLMDRIKASPNMLGKFKNLTAGEYKFHLEHRKMLMDGLAGYKDKESSGALDLKSTIAAIDQKFKHNTWFWWSLGLDQAVHHLTHYGIIVAIMLKG